MNSAFLQPLLPPLYLLTFLVVSPASSSSSIFSCLNYSLSDYKELATHPISKLRGGGGGVDGKGDGRGGESVVGGGSSGGGGVVVAVVMTLLLLFLLFVVATLI